MSELTIKLTQIEKTDQGAIRSLYDGGFSRFWDEEMFCDPYDVESFVDRLEDDDSRRMFVIRAARTSSSNPGRLYVVGICGFINIDWISRHAQLVFIMVDKSGHKSTIQDHPATRIAIKNLLDYGFNELGFNRIWTEVYEHNDVRSCLEKFHFIPEGVRIDSFWHEGKYYNSIVCSVTLNEYNKRSN